MACGAPELEAPTMMSHDGEGHCFFVRQPSTTQETNTAILSTWASCCGAVRYGGEDREVLIRLAEIGSAECCDHRLDNEPRPVNRNHVSFEFVQAQVPKAGSVAAGPIMEYFASVVKDLSAGASRVLDFRCSSIASSFRYEWGADSDVYSVTFNLEPHGELDWLLRILRNDCRPSTAFAITMHKALGRDSRFRRVRWFAEGEWRQGNGEGRPNPY
jgi:hypothetical protein